MEIHLYLRHLMATKDKERIMLGNPYPRMPVHLVPLTGKSQFTRLVLGKLDNTCGIVYVDTMMKQTEDNV
jgi:hypothetical protein